MFGLAGGFVALPHRGSGEGVSLSGTPLDPPPDGVVMGFVVPCFAPPVDLTVLLFLLREVVHSAAFSPCTLLGGAEGPAASWAFPPFDVVGRGAEYPDLQRIKRELSLLQKLYGLYNSVIDSVNGYYDILWCDLDIAKINNELMDFQNRIRKLPKALKEWQAFNDLKKKIDDFSETCPLLEMMANKVNNTSPIHQWFPTIIGV
ncbi:UNVERIFIED_CONTAM: hypothetical protein FKN15_052963 [Acipenser sinensis]